MHDASARALRSRCCACCSSSARRCRSAPSPIRRGWKQRSTPAGCTTRRARGAGSWACSSAASRTLDVPVLRAAASTRLAGRRSRARCALERAGCSRAARARELRAEDAQLGGALARLLRRVGVARRGRGAAGRAPMHARRDVRAGRGALSDVAPHGGAGGLCFAPGPRARCSAAVRRCRSARRAGQRMLAARWRGDPGAASTRALRSPTTRSAASRRAWRSPARARNPVLAAVPLMIEHESHDKIQPLRVGIGGPVGLRQDRAGRRAVQALRDRYDIAVVTNDIYTKEDAQFLIAQRRAARGAHRRRRDRRLPAHRDPRGRVDQPRRRRRAARALPDARPGDHRERRRQPGRHLQPRAGRPDPLRDRRGRRRQDPAQGRPRHHQDPTCWSSTRSTSRRTSAPRSR